MIARFRIRDEVFSGRDGAYLFTTRSADGTLTSEVSVVVDHDGCFEIDGPPPLSILLFAKAVRGDR